MAYRTDWIRLIRQIAPRYGVDPQTALAVAASEGLSGLPGDNNTSWGPFQLHVGGALPAGRDRAWAESPAGITYALQQIGQVAKGLTGQRGIDTIVRRFERPADPTGEVARALSYYPSFAQPGGGGAPPASAPPPVSSPPAASAPSRTLTQRAVVPTPPPDPRQLLVAALLRSSRTGDYGSFFNTLRGIREAPSVPPATVGSPARAPMTGPPTAPPGASGGAGGSGPPVQPLPTTRGAQPPVVPLPVPKGARVQAEPLTSPIPPGSEFAVRDAEGAPDAHGNRYHAAKDWFAKPGSTVFSPVAGRVVEVKQSRGNSGQIFGGVVKVQAPNGMVWVFRHVDPRGVKYGQTVTPGTPLATVTYWADAPTKSHTHIELWKTLQGGYRVENMLDPVPYLAGR